MDTVATLYIEVLLGLAADELWAEITSVGGTCGLIDHPIECSANGDARTCTTVDGTRFVENILGVDEVHRRIGFSGYMLGGSAFPSEFHAASMEVLDTGPGRSTLRWITDIKPDAALDSPKAFIDIEVASSEARHPLPDSGQRSA